MSTCPFLGWPSWRLSFVFDIFRQNVNTSTKTLNYVSLEAITTKIKILECVFDTLGTLFLLQLCME